ncbi:uncharacterized protein Dyak_GE27469 [Drosophila yakuba]|uniref:Uncharacterized protein n=1 Tax=Drosophila yakuba TaxID=7245 RepID=A0A0R1ECV3_DROYA|nr:uncharacterized protein Dyak_GE27469 [Drosophila yakuba]
MISTTDYPSVETTTTAEELYAEYISAPASSMSPAAIAEHLQQNQITFEIPSAHDLRHIDALNSFNALLQRIGNAAGQQVKDYGQEQTLLLFLQLNFLLTNSTNKLRSLFIADKDIRAQIHAASDSYSSHLVGCDASRLLLHQQMQHPHHRSSEAGFYQIESPPCYTIATGLPSYDEALHHQPRHFAYGMKFVYPSLAAVHHHHHCISNWEKQEPLNKLQKCKLSAAVAVGVATEEDKADSSSSTSASASASTSPSPSESGNLATATPAICINMPNGRQDEEVDNSDSDSAVAAASAQSLQPAAPADDDCASLVVVVAA